METIISIQIRMNKLSSFIEIIITKMIGMFVLTVRKKWLMEGFQSKARELDGSLFIFSFYFFATGIEG